MFLLVGKISLSVFKSEIMYIVWWICITFAKHVKQLFRMEDKWKIRRK